MFVQSKFASFINVNNCILISVLAFHSLHLIILEKYKDESLKNVLLIIRFVHTKKFYIGFLIQNGTFLLRS